ncbi:ferritin-like domain-containing protein [Devosia ginsengisoli]|uniref:Ferritin-like domain-containing protein n=1 Tax=Devosia ginsengisoli TaxID=400770 RepID=A0A5B8LX28_9HYPH|nr:ferritin-like domain-containing protein [Devosia ginsengisoli]QDZ12125.1 ferritin-like domain-containing protein [Devosia ginsengisoli]
MTNQTNHLIAGLDPDIKDILVSNRREFFKNSALKLGAMASAPVLLAATAQNAFGQELPQEVVDVLVFALTLEHIEDAFYRSGLETDGLIPDEYVGIFNQIGKHEAAHVAFLSTALGSAAIERPALDLTAGGKYADALSNFDTYLTLSQTFEDLGVAAYKGQAGVVAANDDILTAALQIHSVEARHAAIVRKIGGKKPWDGAFDEPMTKEEVLAAAGPFLA